MQYWMKPVMQLYLGILRIWYGIVNTVTFQNSNVLASKLVSWDHLFHFAQIYLWCSYWRSWIPILKVKWNFFALKQSPHCILLKAVAVIEPLLFPNFSNEYSWFVIHVALASTSYVSQMNVKHWFGLYSFVIPEIIFFWWVINMIVPSYA